MQRHYLPEKDLLRQPPAAASPDRVRFGRHRPLPERRHTPGPRRLPLRLPNRLARCHTLPVPRLPYHPRRSLPVERKPACLTPRCKRSARRSEPAGHRRVRSRQRFLRPLPGQEPSGHLRQTARAALISSGVALAAAFWASSSLARASAAACFAESSAFVLLSASALAVSSLLWASFNVALALLAALTLSSS